MDGGAETISDLLNMNRDAPPTVRDYVKSGGTVNSVFGMLNSSNNLLLLLNCKKFFLLFRKQCHKK